MKVIDSTSGNRSIVLAHNEVLDSTLLVEALVAQELHSREEAVELVAVMLNAVESFLWSQQHAVAA